MSVPEAFGRTIQLFLVNGDPSGLIIASIHGWTGSMLVARQSTFGDLLARNEADRTGVYVLYGPDPDDALGFRAYIGEADCVRERIDQSAKQRSFWEIAVAVTTSDDALNKGHARYLEARLIEMTRKAKRVALDNGNEPLADRRRLSEADRSNMEAFLANMKVVFPVVGLDLLRPLTIVSDANVPIPAGVRFEIRHKSGVRANAVEKEDEFIVLAGSNALKGTAFAGKSYESLKQKLIDSAILVNKGNIYEFVKPFAFRSPSAAAAVVLDRNSNGRQEWRVVGSSDTYHEWQEKSAHTAAPQT